jgi:glycosyltransferase involved in cell wall biosynthesis
MLVFMDNDISKEPGITVVIPCFNAGPRLRPVAESAAARTGRVIVVDDGSTDGSADGFLSPEIEVLRLSPNRGKGHALLAGIRKAFESEKLEVICLMDADGQHDPADLPGLLAAFRKDNADLVIGARQFGGQQVPWRSRFGNRVTAGITRALLGRRMQDTQCGYRLLSPRFARAVLDHVSGGRYETEMEMIVFAVRGGFTLTHAPVQTVYEPGNRSSHFRKVRDSIRIYARLARVLLRR